MGSAQGWVYRIFTFRYSPWAWPALVEKWVARLTGSLGHDEIAFVMVNNVRIRSLAESRFSAAGADLSKVEFLILPTDSIWVRDYGPHFIEQNGTIGIVDGNYYSGRPRDNVSPILLARHHWGMLVDQVGLDYSGGNLLGDAEGNAFLTSRILRDNPSFTGDLIAEFYAFYQGLQQLHLFPTFPREKDRTGHVDMWMSLVDEDTAIIAEFRADSQPDLARITDQAAGHIMALGYEVFRAPAYLGRDRLGRPAHFTYTNALRVNQRIFIPSYGLADTIHLERDAQARAVWSAAAPEAEIISLDCSEIVWAAGALHCIAKQVPLYVASTPSVHITSPRSDELLTARAPAEVTWVSDDDNGTVSVDVYFSSDDGRSYSSQVASDTGDDGHQFWWVPDLETDQARIRVVVRDGEGHDTETVSGRFSIARVRRKIYGFSRGAGENKWVWGHRTEGWSAIDGAPVPTDPGAPIELFQMGAYSRIASSNSEARGGEGRYDSPWPGLLARSTHVFQFRLEEEPSSIAGLTFLWEGYADQASQIELYVWDVAQEQWGDGSGLLGENRYTDNGVGPDDFRLEGRVQGPFERYLDQQGTIGFLLYSERPRAGTHHDYAALVVSYRDGSKMGVRPARPGIGSRYD